MRFELAGLSHKVQHNTLKFVVTWQTVKRARHCTSVTILFRGKTVYNGDFFCVHVSDCALLLVFVWSKRAFSVKHLPCDSGLNGLGRTTVVTSTLSCKQMAKQMILAHLTHDHPYLFHGCWPTDSPCLSLLHECLGRGGGGRCLKPPMHTSVWKTEQAWKTEASANENCEN